MRNLDKAGLKNYVWFIRDNGSTDGSVEEISQWKNVRVLNVNHNRDNFAQGVNSLVELATEHMLNETACKEINSNILLLVNNDVEFADDESINKMWQLMRLPGVGVVGCRLLYPDAEKLQHAGVIFGERYGRMPYHYRHKEQSGIADTANRYFQAVTAAVCMVRYGDFSQIGGMDEKFHWAFEDIDMCLRIGALGRKIAYCGGTKIFHEESASLKKNPVNKLFLGSNVKYFKSKWAGKYEIDHDNYLKSPSYNEIK